MRPLNFSYIEISPDFASRPFHASSMSDPVSPTYTSYSIPSPFSSGSSASYPNHSPVSEPFEVITDLEHHHHPMEDYTVGFAPPSSSLPVYRDMGYITQQDFEYNMVNWSASEMGVAAKRQLPPPPPQQFQQHPSYRSVPPQDLPSEVGRMKNLALYIPPSPTTFHQQQQPSPGVIHSPIPIVPSNAPSIHSPSLANHSPHTTVQPLEQPHRAQVQPQFDVDVEEWRSAPTTAHHTQYPPTYTHTQSHSVAMAPVYPLNGDPSQASMRRTVSDYSHISGNGQRVKHEDMGSYASLGPYANRHTHSPLQMHIFDLSAPSGPSVPSEASQMQAPPLPPTYYARPAPDHLHQQQHQPQAYAVHPAEISPAEPHPGFDAPPADVGYSADVAYEQAGYVSDSGYVEACDPQFVHVSEVIEEAELADPGMVSDLEDEWDVRRRCLEAEYAEAATGAAGELEAQSAMVDVDADAATDVDADGEDDLETSYSHSGYVPPPQQQHQPADATSPRGVSPDLQEELQYPGETTQLDDGDDENDDDELESEDDDTRDPEFVLCRPRRHTSATYPYAESRNLRSTRYNPYPTYSSASPTGRYPDESQSQNIYTSQQHRSRRSYSHTSVSPVASEPYSPLSAGTNMPRRRSRPATTLPIPVPIPNLTKKSRGRRVPTMEDFTGEDGAQTPPKPTVNRKKGAAATAAKGMRTYTCDVDGCGKLFARGEHLKRHIRSIHTYEKPHRCPYPGCGKDFSRHDNLGQHMRVHKDYAPPKDNQNIYNV